MSFINFDTSIFWGSKLSSRDVMSHKTILYTSKVKRCEFKQKTQKKQQQQQKKCRGFPNPLYFFRQHLA